MSDVPELDRLLEEHANFRKNIRFMRQERLFLFCCRVAMAAIVVTFAGIVFGSSGLATIPLAWAWANWFVPKPEWRDPCKRYRVM